MKLTRLTNYLLTHRWQTYVITLLASFLPIVGLFSILLAALVTLRKSVIEGGILTLIACLPFVVAFGYLGNPMNLSVAISSYVLTWVFAVMLQRGASWSQILQVAALLGVLVISVVHLAYPDIATWWGTQLPQYYQQASTMINASLGQPAAPISDMQLEVANASKHYMTGITTVAILLNAILQLIAARWWEAVVFSPGMLRRELHQIRLSRLAGALFVVSIGIVYLGNSVVSDMLPVLYGLFAAAGLSLMHYLISMMKSTSKWFWITLVYLTLIFGFPSSVMLLAFLGLADIWIDMRKRLQKV